MLRGYVFFCFMLIEFEFIRNNAVDWSIWSYLIQYLMMLLVNSHIILLDYSH